MKRFEMTFVFEATDKDMKEFQAEFKDKGAAIQEWNKMAYHDKDRIVLVDISVEELKNESI
jgi:hypothetical protein